MLKPVNKCIFVKPDEPLLKRGALFMPPSDTRQSHGRVLASDSPLCKAGDLIAYARFFPTTVRGEDLVVVDERDLMGVDDNPGPVEGADDKPISKEAPLQPVGGGGPTGQNRGFTERPRNRTIIH